MAKRKWSAREEIEFQRWYMMKAVAKRLDPDPDAPEHYYDYRGYYKAQKAGGASERGGHFPSRWKRKGHPTYHLKRK